MESSNSPNFTQDQLDLIAQAQQRAAADMTGAIKSDELPSDHGRQDFPGTRLSDAAMSAEAHDTSDDEHAASSPKDIVGSLATRGATYSSAALRKKLSPDELAKLNAARRDASARTPQHPPKSRY